jgi:hypothetical protein
VAVGSCSESSLLASFLRVSALSPAASSEVRLPPSCCEQACRSVLSPTSVLHFLIPTQAASPWQGLGLSSSWISRAAAPYFRLPSHVACKLLALFNRRSSYDFSSARHLVSLVRCVSALALCFPSRAGLARVCGSSPVLPAQRFLCCSSSICFGLCDNRWRLKLLLFLSYRIKKLEVF